jgi:cytochrome c peroxidase
MRGDKTKLSDDEKKGLTCLRGKPNAQPCHHPPLFNGLLPPDFIETEVLRVPATTDTLNAKLDADPGKYLFTQSAVHKYSFKTPGLRNIEITAPYMHNRFTKHYRKLSVFIIKAAVKA